MKKIAAILLLLTTSAYAQTPTYTVTTNDQEINVQIELNNLACKTMGLSDGLQACKSGEFLNAKLNEARKPKPESKPEPAKVEPAKVDPVKKP